jgi:hypothetical protein
MEKSSKRGKIPQTDWPLIMTRYEAGETLASIARTYDCSPPAISYIVSRSRERPVPEASPTTDPQLVKVAASEQPTNGTAAVRPPTAVPEVRREPAPERHVTAPPPADRQAEHRARDQNAPFPRQNSGEREQSLFSAPPRATPHQNGGTPVNAPANGDHRRTLHLSLGNDGPGPANGGGSGHAAEIPSAPERPRQPQMPQPTSFGAGERNGYPPSHNAPRGEQGRYGHDFSDRVNNGRAEPQMRADSNGGRRQDAGSFIDQELRTRVDGDIAAFLAAFDAALAEDTQESRFGLREATDRLLRAGARTRIELERLEARVPLTPRDGGGRPEPAGWRPR